MRPGSATLTGSAFERLFVCLAIVADGRDHGPLGADDHVGLEPQAFDALDHVGHVGLASILIHDNDHGRVS